MIQSPPIYVLYHASDPDGWFSREIARYFLESSAQPVVFIGWDHHLDTPVVPDDCTVYMIDVSVPGLMAHPGLIWIDHHKSAIELFPETIKGYRIDGVAACRLAYQWFLGGAEGEDLPVKADYGIPIKQNGREVSRTTCMIQEPIAVKLAGQYDVFDKATPDVDLFQFGIKSRQFTTEEWHSMVAGRVELVAQLIEEGRKIMKYQQEIDQSVVLGQSFDLKFAGLTFLALNSARCNSATFTAGIKQHHDALLAFKWVVDHWTISMYHKPGREDLDLSQIAARYIYNGKRGGGHKGAAGFSCKTLPFKLGA